MQERLSFKELLEDVDPETVHPKLMAIRVAQKLEESDVFHPSVREALVRRFRQVETDADMLLAMKMLFATLDLYGFKQV